MSASTAEKYGDPAVANIALEARVFIGLAFGSPMKISSLKVVRQDSAWTDTWLINNGLLTCHDVPERCPAVLALT
ncbi:hypothetical protein [Arthrobacter sp. MYb213]|uniref:hypothetical protein n=1 Tax=Arthrobacter sp. MYb213 TaxID=1848595 RepID=UPI0015E2B5E5|nr:hypothetical protein [Arthrobacter sp. MYb213]